MPFINNYFKKVSKEENNNKIKSKKILQMIRMEMEVEIYLLLHLVVMMELLRFILKMVTVSLQFKEKNQHGMYA